jgi:hypothetical protein
VLNTPGQDDEDADLELAFDGLDIDGPEPPSAGGEDGADGDDCAPLDDEREQVGYELYDWDPTELDDLDDALHELGLPHEWVSDGYEVVVHVEDEQRVDALLPTIRFPDELPAEADDGDDTDIEVLGALFVAADRMQKDPTGEAVGTFLDAAEQIGELPPYGIDPAQWTGVVEIVDDLIDSFHASAPPREIATRAAALRERLRPLV